jgi:hypothetical protein
MCDCLVALGPATTGGATLYAKASDRPPGEAQRLEWHPSRQDRQAVRTTYIDVEPAAGPTLGWLGSRPAWCWGIEHGVNEAGVAAGNATIYTTLDPRSAPPALIGMDLVRLALERGATAAAATEVILELLERHGQGGSGHAGAHRPYWSSFLLADATDAWVIETSGSVSATERVERSRAISNRTTIAGFDAGHRHPRQPVERLVDPRLDAGRAVLAAGPVQVETLQAHLRSHDGIDGYSVCMHVAGIEVTNAALVAELGPRPVAFVCAGSTCSSVFVPLFVGRPLGRPVAWERFARLGPEHHAALAPLEAGLAADARDDDGWASEAWERVDRALSDVGM